MSDKFDGARARLHSLPHVKAVWTGRDGKLRIGVNRKLAKGRLAAGEIVPKRVEGKTTDVVELRNIKPLLVAEEGDILPGPRELRQKRRPCPGGYSVGHHAITAGTLGCWVRDRNQKWVILSNNHVLANSNEGVEGDRITQPGPVDLDGLTTDPSNWIGHLQEYVTINTESGGGPGGCAIPGVNKLFGRGKLKKRGSIEQPYPNLVDAGVAKHFGGEDRAVDPAIHSIGVPLSIRDAVIGEPVEKTGRTTEHRVDDQIEAIDLSVMVGYGSFSALYCDQILIISEPGLPFSQPGDSGSVIIAGGDLVGLLFAGGEMDDGSDATIANNITHVQALLGISL